MWQYVVVATWTKVKISKKIGLCFTCGLKKLNDGAVVILNALVDSENWEASSTSFESIVAQEKEKEEGWEIGEKMMIFKYIIFFMSD